MAIESRIANDKRVIFREVFTPDSIAKNGGVITGGVSLSNGVVTFDGTGYITYSGNKDLANKSQFTIRMKYKRSATNKVMAVSFLTDLANRTEFVFYSDNKVYGMVCNGDGGSSGHSIDPKNDSEFHEAVVVFDGSGATNVDRMKIYIDNSLLTLGFPSIIPSSSTILGTFYIGKWLAGNSEGSFELVEIYDSALTAEEVSLLHDNRLYSGFIEENCIFFADYMNTQTSLNWKNTDGTHTDTNTTYLHNIGLHCGGATKVEYGTALAITGDWSLETVVDRVWKSANYYYNIGTATDFTGMFINCDGVNDKQWGFYDGTTLLFPEIAVEPFNRQHLVITKEGTSYKFYRGGILINTLAGVDFDITQITVGKAGNDFGGMNGNTAYVREYTGALTAENVAQNHSYAVNNYGAI